MSNLRQLAQGVMMYTRDYGDRFPGAWDAAGTVSAIGRYGAWMTYEPAAPGEVPGGNIKFLPEWGGLWDYVGQKKSLFVCPDDETGFYSGLSYAINWRLYGGTANKNTLIPLGESDASAVGSKPFYYRGLKVSRVKNPAEVFLFVEEGNVPAKDDTIYDSTDDGFFNGPTGESWQNRPPRERHSKGFNIVFVDGHGEHLKLGSEEANKILYETSLR